MPAYVSITGREHQFMSSGGAPRVEELVGQFAVVVRRNRVAVDVNVGRRGDDVDHDLARRLAVVASQALLGPIGEELNIIPFRARLSVYDRGRFYTPDVLMEFNYANEPPSIDLLTTFAEIVLDEKLGQSANAWFELTLPDHRSMVVELRLEDGGALRASLDVLNRATHEHPVEARTTFPTRHIFSEAALDWVDERRGQGSEELEVLLAGLREAGARATQRTAAKMQYILDKHTSRAVDEVASGVLAALGLRTKFSHTKVKKEQDDE